MRIELRKLRAAAEMLFTHCEEMGYESVEIPHDYYWMVMEPECYDPYTTPTKEAGLGLGQLSDDWSEMEDMLRGEDEPIGYGLVWLSALLRAVGEQVIG